MNKKFDQPLVSVIVPTHNRPEFLKRALASIISQTYKNLQIIVISNGFSKENRNIADNIGDDRIVYFEQENSGTPALPRNHGIIKAKGDYVAFCDDDDLWMPEKIEKQVFALSNNLNYDACFSKMIRFNHEKEWTIQSEEGHADFYSLLYVNTIPISSLILRKSFIDRIGSFKTCKRVGYSADYELALRYSLNTKFYFLNEYLIKYWSGDNRTTSLDFHNQLGKSFAYLKTVISCFFIIYREQKINLAVFLAPSFFHIFNTLKVICVLIIKKIKTFLLSWIHIR
jgi:teichuronic acid biosynthesis glycosyltransferase TuaG